MKRFLSILISIILIGITLLPLTISAVQTPGIYIDFFIPSNTSTPIASVICLWSDILNYCHSFDSNLDSNDITVSGLDIYVKVKTTTQFVFDIGIGVSMSHNDGTSSSATFYFATNVTLTVRAYINYIYFNGVNYTTTQSRHTYIPYSYINNTVDSFRMIYAKNQYEEPELTFASTIINVESEEGNTIKSAVLSHEDITTVIGCDDWVGNELEFNDESGQLQLNVTCTTHSKTIVIPTDIYISPLFVLKLVDNSDGSEIDLPTNGKIVLTDYGLEVTPFESSGFTFIVSDDYTQIHGIPINVYNGLGTSLYGSDLVQGTYLNYNIKVDYWQDSYGNVITELVLTIYGQSDIQTFTISVNLADHDITELKGISFSPNKDIPDIKFEYVSDLAIYSGVFYPSSLTDPLNIYVVTPKDAEIIKIDKSEDLNQALQNNANDYKDMQNKYDEDKDGYKEEGALQVDNAGEFIVNYMTGDGANTFNDFLSTIYNIPIIIPMMILVLSVATLGYLFYGKQG